MTRKDVLGGLLVCAAIVALDLASKAIVQSEVPRGDVVRVLPFLDIVNSRNDGIAFGLAGGVSPALIGAALVVLLGLVAYLGSKAHSGWAVWVPAGVLIGGAIANLIDRVVRGSVVDFIDFSFWPAFNLADVAIVVGVGLLVLAPMRDP